MAVDTYTKTGTKSTTPAKLNKAVFALSKINTDLLKEAYQVFLSNKRQNLAVVKTRTQVRGGGRKPWRQKGTGRARVGSIRSPLWKGGGIIFGPTGNETYKKKLNKSAKQTALKQALSLVNKNGKLKIIEQFDLKKPSTKELSGILTKIEASGNVLLVVNERTRELTKSSANLKKVNLISNEKLNVYHLLNSDTVVIDKKSIELITDKLNNEKSSKEAK